MQIHPAPDQTRGPGINALKHTFRTV